MKNLLMTSMVATMAIVPAFSFAATYQYVNTNGSLSTVNANSAEEALEASDISPTSGVMLVASGSSVNPTGIYTYEYVDIYGNLKTVTANNAAQAMTVSDISPRSGVMQL